MPSHKIFAASERNTNQPTTVDQGKVKQCALCLCLGCRNHDVNREGIPGPMCLCQVVIVCGGVQCVSEINVKLDTEGGRRKAVR